MRIGGRFLLFCGMLLAFSSLNPHAVNAQTPALQAPPAATQQGLWWTTISGRSTPEEGFATPDAACRRQFQSYGGTTYVPPYRVSADTYGCRWNGGRINPARVYLRCPSLNWVITNVGACIVPQDIVPEPDCPCPGAPIAASPQPTVGNPVLLSTGAKIDLETDYQTADGLLKVERFYRSRQRGRYHSADHEMPGFGQNWHGIVPARLLVADNSVTMELHTEAGGIDYFSQTNTNINDFSLQQNGINRRKLSMVVPPTTDRASFFINQPSIANGAGEVRLEMANGEYMLFRRSDVYRVAGSLRYMVPIEHGLPNGYVRYFDYPDTGEYPNRVRDNLGRQLDMTWQDVTYYPGQFQLKVLSRVNLPDGSALTYDYAVANIAATTGAWQYGNGGSAERLEKVRRVDPAGTTLWGRDYLYEDVRFPYALTGTKDQNGARLSTYSYSDAGLAITTERAGGVGRNSIEYLQDAPWLPLQNYVRKVTGPLGHKETYSFHRNAAASRGMAHVLKSVEGEASATVPAFAETYDYDLATNTMLTGMTNRNDNVSSSTLDAANSRPDAVIEASGQPEQREAAITYWPNRDWPASITRGALKADYTYTVSGQALTEKLTDLSTQTVPYATGGQVRLTSYTWKPNGRLESVNGPLPVDAQGKDDTATFDYDTWGNLLSVTNGLGHVTSFSDYDLNGRPRQSTDANNIITRFEYDPLGRLKSATVKHPTTPTADAITLFDYDDEGRVTGITRPATDAMLMEYNLAGQLTAIRAVSGERIDFEYNAAGGVTAQTVKRADASASRSITRSFDSLNRMLTETLGAGRTTTWAYDKEGNPELVISARNNATQMAFDGLNRLISTTHPGGGAEGLGYTPLDDVASSTDAIAVTTNFVRNGFGETIQEISPDRGTSVYYYNAAGQVSSVIDGRGQRIDYTRDILGRVTSKTPVGRPVSEVVGYVWDIAAIAGSYSIGRLGRVDDNSGNTRFGYDHRGNLVTRKAQVTHAGVTTAFNLSYQYDLSDRILQITYPSGRQVAYDRDSKGRVSAIRTKASAATTAWTNIATGMAYEPFASLKSATLGNALVMNNNWGNDGRLAFRRLKTNTGVSRSYLTYAYDNDDNITGIIDNVTPSNSRTFGYDARGRLSQTLWQSGSFAREDILHDANGNRTAVERRIAANDNTAAQTDIYTRTADTNKLASIDGTFGTRSITYDARGNTLGETRSGGISVTTSYDGHGRLTSLTRTGEEDQANIYNGMDERVLVSSGVAGGGMTSRRFVYDPDGRVLGEYGTSALDVIAERIWMNPEVADSGMFGGDDGTGGYAPIAIVAGTTLSWVHANHIGVPQLYTGASGAIIATPAYTLPGFPGQFRTFADLYYNKYRDYDTTTGRYIQADPIGLDGGQSPYGYAMGNPLRYVDPKGTNVLALVPEAAALCLTPAGAVVCTVAGAAALVWYYWPEPDLAIPRRNWCPQALFYDADGSGGGRDGGRSGNPPKYNKPEDKCDADYNQNVATCDTLFGGKPEWGGCNREAMRVYANCLAGDKVSRPFNPYAEFRGKLPY